jgi:hypothetical protein
VLVYFTRNHRKSTKAGLVIGGTKIQPSDEARYIGVIFDKALRFKSHIQYAIKRGTLAALALGSISRASWGASYIHVRQQFKATVASQLDYTVIVWHQPHANASIAAATAQLKKFTTVQRLAMKATLGCYMTTLIVAMEVESGLETRWIRH